MTDKPKYPSAREQLRNLKNTVRDVARNPRLCSHEEKKARLDICKSCEYYTGSRCKKCGCFLQTKAKFKAAKCPIRKW